MQSHALQSLPEGYREILHLDLQKDKKSATTVNVLAVVLAVVLGIVFHLMVPISSFFRTTGDLAADLEDIPDYVLAQFTIVQAEHIQQVLDTALARE